MTHVQRFVLCLAHSMHLGMAGLLVMTVLAEAPADPRPMLGG